jgi:hypothetical protein
MHDKFPTKALNGASVGRNVHFERRTSQVPGRSSRGVDGLKSAGIS